MSSRYYKKNRYLRRRYYSKSGRSPSWYRRKRGYLSISKAPYPRVPGYKNSWGWKAGKFVGKTAGRIALARLIGGGLSETAFQAYPYVRYYGNRYVRPLWNDALAYYSRLGQTYDHVDRVANDDGPGNTELKFHDWAHTEITTHADVISDKPLIWPLTQIPAIDRVTPGYTEHVGAKRVGYSVRVVSLKLNIKLTGATNVTGRVLVIADTRKNGINDIGTDYQTLDKTKCKNYLFLLLQKIGGFPQTNDPFNLYSAGRFKVLLDQKVILAENVNNNQALINWYKKCNFKVKYNTAESRGLITNIPINTALYLVVICDEPSSGNGITVTGMTRTRFYDD